VVTSDRTNGNQLTAFGRFRRRANAGVIRKTGYNSRHGIANVTSEGLEISGRPVTSAEDADMYLNYVRELRFRLRPDSGQPTAHDDDSE
jgi:hypothetical protein